MENKYNELAKLNQLKATITEQEFETQKQKILNLNAKTLKVSISKIFFLLVGIAMIITIILSFKTNQCYKNFWENWEIDSKKYTMLESKWEIMKNTTILFIIMTNILFIIGNVIQFMSNKINKKKIMILLVGIIVMIIFTISSIFLAQLN